MLALLVLATVAADEPKAKKPDAKIDAPCALTAAPAF
jgi:hypothetical protein